MSTGLKPFIKYFFYLLLLTVAFIAIGLLVVKRPDISMSATNVGGLALTFSIISFTTLIIFFVGQTKAPGDQFLYTLTAISLKFILEAVAALIWFVVAKNIQTQYVLLFFILYLAFTFFLVTVILNVLNNKAL